MVGLIKIFKLYFPKFNKQYTDLEIDEIMILGKYEEQKFWFYSKTKKQRKQLYNLIIFPSLVEWRFITNDGSMDFSDTLDFW